MVNAPLVMPEVIIGLSLLLLMVASQRIFGFPERGFATLVLGHTLLGMAYATTVITSRLQDMDRSIEEAAMDLGATEFGAFRKVTLPILLPGIVAAALLAFTIS